MPKQDEEPRTITAPQFLTLRDVATYLGVSSQQVYALVRSGDLPGLKIGGRGIWRVDRADLDEYVKRVKQETAEWAKSHPLTQRDEGA